MCDRRQPMTFNSQGLVRKRDSLNSSQANLISQPVSDFSLEDLSLEDIVPKVFLAMSNGIHPFLITEMFHSSKSLKQLVQLMTNIFSHGVKTDQVETSIVMAKQFHSHKYYTRAMVDSMDVLIRSHARLDIVHLVTLLSDVYEMLGSGRDSLTPLLVDTLVKWVSPTVDMKKEIMLAEGANIMILKTGPTIGQSSLSGYKLVFDKVRAELVGDRLVAETRAVLLDMMVIMGRQVMPGVKGMYLVDCEQQEESLPTGREEFLEESVAREEETMLQNNSKEDLVESKVEVAPLDSGYACTFATDVEKIKAALAIECEEKVKAAMNIEPVEKQPESGHVLVPPSMFEEYAGQAALTTREENQKLSPDMLEENAASAQAALTTSEENLNLLGHLVSKESGFYFPVTDSCTIGRDSSCSIMLPGREVSRLHARVFFSEGEVIIESVGKINNVRTNGIIVNQVASLKEGDRVQVGKEVLVWQREGGKQKEDISEDTLWGEKESPKNVSDEVLFESEEVKKDDADCIEQANDSDGEDENEAAISDSDSVVVEMINFF